MMRYYLATVASVAALAAAQTFTDCNPLEETCPANPALARSVDLSSFTQTPDIFREQSESFSYSNGEANFVIQERGNAPTYISNSYIFFGSVSVVLRAATGTGIVSSVVLQSDCLDEIDWEWLGGDGTNVQTNYFGKGDTSSYDRVTFVPVQDPQNNFHNYTINWSPETIDWIIDGAVVRTLTYAEAQGGSRYPQTPMTVRLGSWSGGSSENEGTREWAGGPTDFTQGPFTMSVRSISIVDASSGSAYEYSDNSGSWESIRVLDGEGPASSASEAQASTTALETGSQAIGLPAGRTSTPASASTVSSVSENSSTINSTSSGSNPSGATATQTAENDSGSTDAATPSSVQAEDSSVTPSTGAAVTIRAVNASFILSFVYLVSFSIWWSH